MANRIKRQLWIICLFCLSCGGGGGPPEGGGESADTGISDISASKQVATISWEDGYVSVAGINEGQTKFFAILIPVSLFARGGVISLGADGFFGQSKKEGLFVLYRGTRLLETNKNVDAVYVSGGGSVSLQEASFNDNGEVRGTLHLDHLIAIDPESGIFARDASSGTANFTFSAKLVSGGTKEALIHSVDKSVVSKGDTLTVSGANLSALKEVGYRSCPGRLPFEVVSDYEIRVTIDNYPCPSGDGLYFSYVRGQSSFPLEVIPPPHLKNFRAPVFSPPAWKDFSRDTQRDLVFFRDTGKRVRVFSFNDGGFIASAYWDKSVEAIDYLSQDDDLYIKYWGGGGEIVSLDGVGEQDRLASVRMNPWPVLFQLSGPVVFGKGRKGLAEGSWELKWVDLDTNTVSALPMGWRTPFGPFSDALLRSQNRKYILLNRQDGSWNPTVVFRPLDDGNIERRASVVIGKKILGISEAADEFWGISSVYDVSLNRLSDYGGNVPEWNLQKAIGIVFDPGNRYAILIAKNGRLHILDRQTRALLAGNVPAVAVDAVQLALPHFLSEDGSKLLLTSEGMIHLVDLRELFRTVGLPY